MTAFNDSQTQVSRNDPIQCPRYTSVWYHTHTPSQQSVTQTSSMLAFRNSDCVSLCLFIYCALKISFLNIYKLNFVPHNNLFKHFFNFMSTVYHSSRRLVFINHLDTNGCFRFEGPGVLVTMPHFEKCNTQTIIINNETQ